MNNNKYFDDEDENIFSDKDISHDAPLKAPRPVPTWLMTEFLAWLDRSYPDLQMVSNLSRNRLSQLIRDFEFSIGQHYDYTAQDWQHSLQRP